MKRYLITNPKFKGEAELLYDADGILKKIDCTQTDMSQATMHHFKLSVPANSSQLQSAFSELSVIVEAKMNVHFNEFWLKYNYKFNKDRCEKLWIRLSQTDQIKAFYGLDSYQRYLRKNEGIYKMHPDTYLRNKSWENDYK